MGEEKAKGGNEGKKKPLLVACRFLDLRMSVETLLISSLQWSRLRDSEAILTPPSLLSLHPSILPISFLHLLSPFLSLFAFQNFKSLLFASHIVKSSAYEMNKSESYIDEGLAGYLQKRELQPRVISDLMVGALRTRRDPWPSQKMVRDTSNRKGCSSWFFFFFKKRFVFDVDHF